MLAAIVVLSVVCLLPGPEHLGLDAYFALLIPGLFLISAVVLAGERFWSSRFAYPALYGWSVADIGFITALVCLTGGGRSQLYLLYALTCMFYTSCYPRRTQLILNGLSVAAYLGALVGTGWHISATSLILRGSVLGLVAFSAGSISSEKDRQARLAERRAALLRQVSATAREVNLLDADKVCDAVVEGVCELGMKASHISLFDEDAGTYYMIRSRGIPEVYATARPPASAGIVGMVRQARATIALDGSPAWDYVVPVVSESQLTAVMGSPLWVDGELVGVLAGATREKRSFGPADVEAFELLASVASRALEGARRFERMADNEARHRYQASHDDLTGLPNRRLLNTALSEALAEGPSPAARRVALLLVDLDDFKVINDTLGHGAGDQVLVAVALRLSGCASSPCTVARLSGDEFAILAPGLSGAELDLLARRALEEVNAPVLVDGHELFVGASIGIALEATVDCDETERQVEIAAKLLSNADMAMYEAKKAGKGCYVMFDRAMSDQMNWRLAIETHLAGAIANDEMAVHYQPIFELGTGYVTGCEALLRWTSPVLGPVSPAEFIPVAEETGAIVPIGSWVLAQACTELSALHHEDERWAALTMSVNLSPRQLKDPGLVGTVVEALEQNDLKPWQLTLEITESSLVQDTEASQEKLSALAARGVQIALDDFGTGYSSLSYLQQLQVHSLKIDKCFVDGVSGASDDRTARALVRSVAELSRALELSTVAEGVETPEQVEELCRLGCHLAQGYVFSPAVPPDRLRALLTDHVRPLRAPALDAAPAGQAAPARRR
jgi:diguanylate cyclase (GGDEF)-like protein